MVSIDMPSIKLAKETLRDTGENMREMVVGLSLRVPGRALESSWGNPRLEIHARALANAIRDRLTPQQGVLRHQHFFLERQGAVANLSMGSEFEKPQGEKRWLGSAYCIAQSPEKVKKVVIVQSHMDSVPGGGNIDGRLGVAYAIDAAAAIKDQVPEDTAVIVVYGVEESSTTGEFAATSKILVGQTPSLRFPKFGEAPSNWQKLSVQKSEKPPLQIMLQSFGIQPDNLENLTFMEAHSEQASGLERAQRPCAWVDKIATAQRPEIEITVGESVTPLKTLTKITIRGRNDHSGAAAPNERLDAYVAAAEVALSEGVQVYGFTPQKGQSRNVVPGEATLWVGAKDIGASLDVLKQKGFNVTEEKLVASENLGSDPSTICASPETMGIVFTKVREANELLQEFGNNKGVRVTVGEITRSGDTIMEVVDIRNAANTENWEAFSDRAEASLGIRINRAMVPVSIEPPEGLPPDATPVQSWAGHDIQIYRGIQAFAGKIRAHFLFVQSQGGSHSPRERVNTDHVEIGFLDYLRVVKRVIGIA